MRNNIAQTVKEISTLLTPEIENLKSIMAKSIGSDVSLINQIYDYINSHSGKMLRPILTILTAKSFNYSGIDHIKLGAAIELIHAATLLHDDVIDESPTRHNQLTVNLVFSNKSAILMGDYLFSKAFQLMVETNNIEVLGILSNSSAIISKGEIHQLEHIGDLNLNVATYLNIIEAKTAYLFKATTHVGSLIATTRQDDIEQMANYGYNMGVAFQIIDDINDYLAPEIKTGKSLCDDLKEGKITLPLILALNKANKEEKNFLTNLIQSPHKSNEDIKAVIDLLHKHNCMTEARTVANNYINLAKNNINEVASNINYKDCFIKLAEALQ